MTDITIEVDGQSYDISYTISMDGEHEVLTMYLPNGDMRQTVLSGGLKMETAMQHHVRAYLKHKKAMDELYKDVMILIGAGNRAEALKRIESCSDVATLDRILSALNKVGAGVEDLIDAVKERLRILRGGQTPPKKNRP